MRIRVVSRYGEQEILTLVGPLEVTETNRENGMSHFLDACGIDYFFNDSDGTYDGWGRAAPAEGISEQQADDVIDLIQAARELVAPILPSQEALGYDQN